LIITPNKAIDTLRDRGLRLTRPRRIILDVVRATDAHPTGAFVYRRVRRRLPRVSLATVYRNLRMLAAEGFLAERADEAGMRFDANALIRDNVASLAAVVREGREIVVPGPTCSYMLKQEYPWLDGSDDAKLVAANTRDLFEYLAKLHAAGELDTTFSRPVGAVTYHVPCHLRAQNIGHKSADVLRAIPGASVGVVEKCSAVDGTWGFKKDTTSCRSSSRNRCSTR
jgi:Fe-S oxidoreductase